MTGYRKRAGSFSGILLFTYLDGEGSAYPDLFLL